VIENNIKMFRPSKIALWISQRPAPQRVGCFILCLLVLWLPFAIPIYLLVEDGNLESIFTMVLLYGEFIFWVRLWGKKIYQRDKILTDYGLELSSLNGVDFCQGLSLGVLSIILLFGVQGLLGWILWQPPKAFIVQIVLEGLLVAGGIGFAEELLFRGWLLDELNRDYDPRLSTAINAILFAVAHFIRPISAIISTLPQFPALVLLGLTQVWGKHKKRGRLGLPMGLHSGLVWGYYIINVCGLVQPSGVVPDWVTGVNNNPLQGIVGMLGMALLAYQMRAR